MNSFSSLQIWINRRLKNNQRRELLLCTHQRFWGPHQPPASKESAAAIKLGQKTHNKQETSSAWQACLWRTNRNMMSTFSRCDIGFVVSFTDNKTSCLKVKPHSFTQTHGVNFVPRLRYQVRDGWGWSSKRNRGALQWDTQKWITTSERSEKLLCYLLTPLCTYTVSHSLTHAHTRTHTHTQVVLKNLDFQKQSPHMLIWWHTHQYTHIILIQQH